MLVPGMSSFIFFYLLVPAMGFLGKMLFAHVLKSPPQPRALVNAKHVDILKLVSGLWGELTLRGNTGFHRCTPMAVVS